MGKNDNKKKVDTQIQNAQDQANRERDQWNTTQQGERAEAANRQREMYQSQFDALSKLSSRVLLLLRKKVNLEVC